jgi:uncharacterized protein YlxW (UPF0749 family)
VHRHVRATAGGHLGVSAVLVVAGLLFTASARAAGGSDLRRDDVDLPGLIREETAAVESTSEDLAALRAEVEALTASVGDESVRGLREAADKMASDGGLAPVEGPGVVVRLDDAPLDRPVSEDVDADLLVVHQQDVQAVVNALWTGGAEAMTLMDQRVVSTSAVRCVGSTLRLQGRVYSPPYTIQAIGDPGRLEAALHRSPDVQIYQEYVRAYGLGYEERTSTDLRMPAFDGPLEMQHARVPAGEQG